MFPSILTSHGQDCTCNLFIVCIICALCFCALDNNFFCCCKVLWWPNLGSVGVNMPFAALRNLDNICCGSILIGSNDICASKGCPNSSAVELKTCSAAVDKIDNFFCGFISHQFKWHPCIKICSAMSFALIFLLQTFVGSSSWVLAACWPLWHIITVAFSTASALHRCNQCSHCKLMLTGDIGQQKKQSKQGCLHVQIRRILSHNLFLFVAQKGRSQQELFCDVSTSKFYWKFMEIKIIEAFTHWHRVKHAKTRKTNLSESNNIQVDSATNALLNRHSGFCSAHFGC